MKKVILPLREVEAIAVTRFLFGIGVTLLLGRFIPARQRPWVGWLLVALGLLSTPPLIYDVYVNRVLD